MTHYREESFSDKLAGWLPVAAIIAIVLVLLKFAYDWVMAPAHFLIVTIAVVASIRYVRLSRTEAAVLVVGYLLFFSAYLSGQSHPHSTTPASAITGSMGTVAGGSAR